MDTSLKAAILNWGVEDNIKMNRREVVCEDIKLI
jgi:hypothetical protein